MRKTIVIAVTGLLFSLPVLADSPYLVNKQTGKFLGNLNNNRYDPDSTSNPYGRYGSQYSPDSINNEYGRYGSEYSQDSANNPNNPYASNPPQIRHGGTRSTDGGDSYLPQY